MYTFRQREQHIDNLKLIFEKCRVYRIYLNLEKCVFMVRQGKILGHIVSKNGISIDFEKIKVIVELPRPRNMRSKYRALWVIVDIIDNLSTCTPS